MRDKILRKIGALRTYSSPLMMAWPKCSRSIGGLCLGRFHAAQGNDYSRERYRVDREDCRGAGQCHGNAADCRSNRSGGVCRDAGQSRGGRYLLARDNLGLNRLPGRSG